MAISRGLSVADDGWFATNAQCLATGAGYSTPFSVHTDVTEVVPFNAYTGTGPTLVIPCAIALALAGANDVVPGLVAVAMWAALLTLLLVQVQRRVSGGTFLVGTAVLSAAILSVFAFHFEHWFAFLGEAPAIAMIAWAHWLLAMHRPSARCAFGAGLLLGLAVQAKLLSALSVPGACFILLVRLRQANSPLRVHLRWLAVLLLGCALPTLAFELYKLQQLGAAGFVENWREFRRAFRSMGVGGDELALLARLAQRLTALHERFGVHPAAAAVFAVLVLLAARRALHAPWRLLLAGLAVACGVHTAYWLFKSVGLPRYQIIPIGLSCIALCIPIWGCRRWLPRCGFTLAALVLIAPGLPRLSFALGLADRGLFQPTTERLARDRVVATLRELQAKEGAAFVSPWWATCIDVEFLVPGHVTFRRLEALPNLRGPKYVLLNHKFANAEDPVLAQARARTVRTVLTEGPFELFEVR
jgi:hypothetical protein